MALAGCILKFSACRGIRDLRMLPLIEEHRQLEHLLACLRLVEAFDDAVKLLVAAELVRTGRYREQASEFALPLESKPRLVGGQYGQLVRGEPVEVPLPGQPTDATCQIPTFADQRRYRIVPLCLAPLAEEIAPRFTS